MTVLTTMPARALPVSQPTTAIKNTVSMETYSPMHRGIDWALWASEVLRLPICNIEINSILDAAKRSTGLDDWGDEFFIPRLERVIKASQDAEFTSIARFVMRQVFIRAVMNRLSFQDHLKRNPEIHDVEIKRPIFVVGFPRTGTTLLQNLLQLDPNRRALQFWELTIPTPLIQNDPVADRLKRMKQCQREVDMMMMMVPEMQDVHFISAETAEECWALFCNSASAINWELQSGLTDYGNWLTQSDMSKPYQEYKTHLKSLLWERPAENLILKCPEHLWSLDALLKEFPDAGIVWTHRDPYDCCSSYSSMISLNRRLLYGKINPHEVGAHISTRFLDGVERAMAVRDQVGEDRFFDTNFMDLVRNPGQVVHDIADKFGITDVPDTAINEYLSRRRQDERGKHKYDGSRYGLDRKTVHDSYAKYIDRFNIKIKTDSQARGNTPVAPPVRKAIAPKKKKKKEDDPKV